MDSLTKLIEDHRKRKGLTQEQIANALEMSRNNYHRMINRGKKMSLIQIEQIANALGIDIEMLITGQTSKEEEIKNLNSAIERLSLKVQNLSLRHQNAKHFFVFYMGQIFFNIVNQTNEDIKVLPPYGKYGDIFSSCSDDEEIIRKIIERHFWNNYDTPFSLDTEVINSMIEFFVRNMNYEIQKIPYPKEMFQIIFKSNPEFLYKNWTDPLKLDELF